jgi:hypothetical protein
MKFLLMENSRESSHGIVTISALFLPSEVVEDLAEMLPQFIVKSLTSILGVNTWG